MSTSGNVAEGRRWGALSYPNYRRYWLSNVAMVFGLQFRFIASGWLVYELTNSPFWLGVPGVVTAAVTVGLTVPGGALADRVDNQWLLAVGRALSALLNLLLAVAVLSGAIAMWMILVWAVVGGGLAAITNPASNALLPRLIDRSAMSSAVAYSSAIWNSMRIVGPALAGLGIATLGVGPALLVTAAGYVVSTALVLSLRLAPLDAHDGSAASGMWGGVRYILGNPLFLATIGLSFFSSLLGRSYVVLLPVFADDILGVGVRGFGYMEAAAGVGALLGTLSSVRIPPGRHSGAVMIGAAVAFGLCVGAFAGSRSLPLSLGLLFAGGVFASVYLNLGMTTLQLRVPDALRGRVMGVWGLTWFLGPAGGFVAGSVAEIFGAPLAVAAGAFSVAGFAVLVYLLFADVRHTPDPAPHRAEE